MFMTATTDGTPGSTPKRTAQESLWAGDFGSSYITRNRLDVLVPQRLGLWSRILARADRLESVVELGPNIGSHLRALRALIPNVRLEAVEINETAVQELRQWGGASISHGSLLDWRPSEPADLAYTWTVLIHVNPEKLAAAYATLYESSRRYILVGEYYNPTPVTVPYRGETDALFKRDFAGELLDRYPDLRLVDYGFAYHRDPIAPSDDTTWFLLEKR